MSAGLRVALGARRYRTDRAFYSPQAGGVSDVAVGPDGRIHVLLRRDPLADPPCATLVTLDAAGRVLQETDPGIADAHMLAAAPDGRLYVVDRDAHEVLILRDGLRVGGLGGRHRPGQPFNHPTGIAIGPDGSVYVCEGYAGHTVWRFAPDGTELARWGSYGSGPGQFRNAHGLWVLPDGRVAVADRENDRVQIFTPDGGLLRVIALFRGPMDIWGDAEGVLHVSDSMPALSRVTAEGAVLGRARPVLNGAHGLCGAPDGTIYFAEMNPNRVSRILPLTEEAPDGL